MRLVSRTLGELLITAGALVLLFVLWQLVWTDVTAASAQRDTLTELEERFAERPPDAGVVPPEGEPVAQEPATAPVAEPVPEGESFAVVHVPRFGDDWAVGADEGVGLKQVLNDGVLGHYPGTAMPGAVGNAAFAGHRTTYGKPMNQIAELVDGDPVVVESADAYYVYRVTGRDVVAPTQVDVIAPVPGDAGAEPTERLLTLTACHPMFSARQRYVVHAALESWQPRSAGPPAAMTDEPATAGA